MKSKREQPYLTLKRICQTGYEPRAPQAMAIVTAKLPLQERQLRQETLNPNFYTFGEKELQKLQPFLPETEERHFGCEFLGLRST